MLYSKNYTLGNEYPIADHMLLVMGGYNEELGTLKDVETVDLSGDPKACAVRGLSRTVRGHETVTREDSPVLCGGNNDQGFWLGKKLFASTLHTNQLLTIHFPGQLAMSSGHGMRVGISCLI